MHRVTYKILGLKLSLWKVRCFLISLNLKKLKMYLPCKKQLQRPSQNFASQCLSGIRTYPAFKGLLRCLFAHFCFKFCLNFDLFFFKETSLTKWPYRLTRIMWNKYDKYAFRSNKYHHNHFSSILLQLLFLSLSHPNPTSVSVHLQQPKL